MQDSSNVRGPAAPPVSSRNRSRRLISCPASSPPSAGRHDRARAPTCLGAVRGDHIGSRSGWTGSSMTTPDQAGMKRAAVVWLAGVAVIAAVSAVAFALGLSFPTASFAFLLAIVVLSLFATLAAAIVFSVLAALSLNYLFL